VHPLTIAVAQPRCTAHDVAANAAAHADLVRAAGARVVVFPELSLTGYELGAAPVDPGDDRLGLLVDACRDTGAVALVGAPVASDGGVSIGMLAVTGDGASAAYRKMFLGGAEPPRFVAGTEPAVLEVDGWRLGLAVCKDTGVAEHAARTCALGIDVYVAGVLELPADAAVPEERAVRIATEHGVWVAIASFAGDAGSGYDGAPGGSGVWRPDGTVAARAGAQVGEVVAADVVPVTAG
jgi:predicted amidohydrolase